MLKLLSALNYLLMNLPINQNIAKKKVDSISYCMLDKFCHISLFYVWQSMCGTMYGAVQYACMAVINY